uniref:Uncharacterized protein n=1 Tax=Lactuca sativa TaxID=4236 RepID=A0A9R1X137_LACSA|nr:hypothetical protein LSAT_V11C700343150 [Lactuca sativa]
MRNMSEDFKRISDLEYGSPGKPLRGNSIRILGQKKKQGYIQLLLTSPNCYTISRYACPEPDEYQKWLENPVYINVGMASSITCTPRTLAFSHKIGSISYLNVTSRFPGTRRVGA